MLYWTVERTGNPRFPYRISISDENGDFFAVRSQDAWPGPKGNIFCIRDGSSPAERDLFMEIERIPVLSFERFGRSLKIILDRPTKKRCEFLILEKAYRNREGSYEQIFFKTDSAQKEHKSRSRVALRPGLTKLELTVAIDSAERYPWKFPKAKVEQRRLPAGDYALMHNETILAVVERKTYENLLTDFDSIVILHRSLDELSGLPNAAMVIEAHYGDFMNPKRLEGRWPAAHAYRVISELQAMHPHLPIIFAGTRKEANLWTYAFFRAIAWKHERERLDEDSILLKEPSAFLGAISSNISSDISPRLDEKVYAVLNAKESGLTLRELALMFEDVDAGSLRHCLERLRRRGRVQCEGRGISARWYFSPPDHMQE
ncbi:MAG TPA: ERCC4 domain-containing protein [Rectinema sp.]|nr:ERCC4 domain-containing protein [Spirochaetia bacterium]HOE76549.1 ERCC4 domain-containing protein [Rectinema sp.]HOR49162.1 ERCC4 domain-containing protein [Rectinema sp.]HPL71910.1 ERCC4 domain-containing protein [Rectinema sp.]HPN03579.1 ERCC4 domain-containing protein [Rectinema sp.]